MADWGQVHVASASPDSIEDLLLALGAVSVTLRDAADSPIFEPAPGEIRIWPETVVTGLFEADVVLELVRQALLASGLCEAHHIRLEQLADRAWEREWLSDFAPTRFGQRLWVSPVEAQPCWPEGAVVLRMDPGLAFGTGTHPTTRLCLQWLDRAKLAGRTVIDYGCGSGVLAVAAALLGAERVIAYDIDPQALTATAENARRNGVVERVELRGPEQPPVEAADVVLANILAGTLIALRDEISVLVRPQGELVLSGILAEQAQAVRDVYADAFSLMPENSEAWVRLDGRRFAPPG